MTGATVAAADGDSVHVDLRLVVAPSAGTFRPAAEGQNGKRGAVLQAGTVVGYIEGPSSDVDVATFCDGHVVRTLAHPGERVRPGQPLVWIQPVDTTGSAFTIAGDDDDDVDSRPAPEIPLGFLGAGAALPALRMTNDDLAEHFDTSDEWISARTGIRARHVADPAAAETTTALAADAGARALAAAGLDPEQIDLVVVATATPDSACPSTAARVAQVLGIEAAAFDVNGACCGFVHALHAVAAMVAVGPPTNALVIGAERFTTLVDPDDRATAVLFGDGAGALVVAAGIGGAGATGILAADLGGAPSALAVLEVPTTSPYLRMDGPELYRRATRSLASSALATLERAGLTPQDVDLWVPHQANSRIISAAAERIGLTPDQVVVDLTDRANTSAASIPLALSSIAADGRLDQDKVVLLSAIGAGIDWTSLLLRWGR
ncbi:beta-ketoacyl-ACP synthase 3 [Aquihabitans sp. McL0605]|uniref:beta-ketoacyl-ACP synthase 3 n=1 Tax=Aquihabitans sp. McL0605 TaxID=3415671 RepID=UPI003CEAB41B